MKRIIIVSHCILNTCAKVESFDMTEISIESNYRHQFLTWALENDIQLLQLPCPEFILYGSKRWGHVKEQYSHSYFRKECQKMLQPLLIQLEEYCKFQNEYDIIGVVGIDGSPNCGINYTCCGDWGGEISNPNFISKQQSLHMSNEPGVFIEELQKELHSRNISLTFFSLNNFPINISYQ